MEGVRVLGNLYVTRALPRATSRDVQMGCLARPGPPRQARLENWVGPFRHVSSISCPSLARGGLNGPDRSV
jgi:hypothetical protein